MITVNLDKSAVGQATGGISLDLSKEDPGLRNVKILLNWDEHPVHSASLTEGFDLDLWAICLDANGKLTSMEQICWYNNKNCYSGAVVLSGDNRTGAGDDDEYILVDLSKVPGTVGDIAFYVFIHDAPNRGQNFGMVANANVKVINADSGKVISQYNITQDFNGQTAVCVGNLSKSNFTPDGGAGVLGPNEVLAHYQ